MKDFIRDLIRKLGFDIHYFGRSIILKDLNIDLVLDVGANEGQYAKSMRRIGYEGRIISFEPLKVAFLKLQKASSSDHLWIVNNYALGNENINSSINISSNSYSSSIMEMTNFHKSASKESAYIDKQNIEIKTLDSIFAGLSKGALNILLKIDTQGFEKNVLLGSLQSLSSLSAIQLEVSMVELYQGEDIFLEIINFLDSINFKVVSIEPGFFDKKTGFMLQCDLICVPT